jgi:hypothetical protein
MNRSWLAASSVSLLIACGNASLDLGPGGAPAPIADASARDAISPPDATEETIPDSLVLDDVGRVPTFEEEARALGARWKWLDPLPSGEPMYGVAGTSVQDVWYVGSAGTALHWNGTAWKEIVVAEPIVFRRAWSPARGATWAFGEDAQGRPRTFRIFSDGTSVEDRALTGVEVQAFASAGSSAAIAVCARGEVRLWDGTEWRTIRAATGNWLRAAHAFSPDRILAVGDAGEIVRFDGRAWTTESSAAAGRDPFDTELLYEGIWGSAPNDVWAVAIQAEEREVDGGGKQHLPVFVHFDGTRWSVAHTPRNVCGEEAPRSGNSWAWWNEIRPASRRLDQRSPTAPALIGTSRHNLLFVSQHTCPFRYDGVRWSPEPRSWQACGEKICSTEGGGGMGLVALDATSILAGDRFLDASTQATPAPGANPRWRPTRRWGGGSSYHLMLDRDGRLWDSRPAFWTSAGWNPLGSIGLVKPSGFFVRSAADLWVADAFSAIGPLSKGLWHWDGTRWTVHAYSDPRLVARAIDGNDDELYVITSDSFGRGEFLRRSGDATRTQPLPSDVVEAALLAPTASDSSAIALYSARPSGGDHVACELTRWDGASPPVVEASIEHCSPNWGRLELHRMRDGRIAILTPTLLATWDGTNVSRVLDGVLELRGIASLDEDRYWLTARDGIHLWNARTGQRALARHTAGVSRIVANARGEAWAAGAGLMHFVPETSLDPR